MYSLTITAYDVRKNPVGAVEREYSYLTDPVHAAKDLEWYAWQIVGAVYVELTSNTFRIEKLINSAH